MNDLFTVERKFTDAISRQMHPTNEEYILVPSHNGETSVKEKQHKNSKPQREISVQQAQQQQ